MNCIICGRPVEEKKAKTYELTAEERRVLTTLLQDPAQPDPTYCAACDRIMRDPEQASQLMKGLFLTMMRKAGVPLSVAEPRAEQVYRFYLQKAMKPRS